MDIFKKVQFWVVLLGSRSEFVTFGSWKNENNLWGLTNPLVESDFRLITLNCTIIVSMLSLWWSARVLKNLITPELTTREKTWEFSKEKVVKKFQRYFPNMDCKITGNGCETKPPILEWDKTVEFEDGTKSPILIMRQNRRF